ncbi:hypothetical protein CEP52_012651 [Fusarium oligoseptatum]|uniref:Sexual differentiation process protein isp4 n=1 Tax=Fusarium oligoseptatum TaxID=2604345 RepID=A0A428SXA1_9HYPO|nr:hypothetical protein CEP52_012651 [Fusarium oligoseptatum]
MADNEKRVSTGGVSEVADDRNPQQQYQEQSQEQVITDSSSEYNESFSYDQDDMPDYHAAEQDLHVTEDDLLEARELASKYTLEDVRDIMGRIRAFLENDELFTQPEKHENLVQEMKLEAALITNNSPYAEVRAVVENKDDTSIPSSTIRSWAIGLTFSVLLAFTNQLFDIRQPAIRIMANVAQLLSYPIGKGCERWLPDLGFTFLGVRHSLNPGPFSKKEHMLITIMANVAYNTPYTNLIIWVQYLPQYFNQPYASHFAYQILIALSTNFIGYGMAGVCRRFLVYPSYCVWPASLVTIALNSAFHTDNNSPVQGPFAKIWRVSRIKFFYVMFGAMFIWFWLPNYLWTSLSNFSWMTWIDPTHRDLSTITGFNNGLGINPFPTWDWNVLLWDSADPLMVPFFSTFNRFVGAFISMWVVLGLWYSNIYNTGFLPINSNRVYDRFGDLYNVTRAINDRGLFDAEKYEDYSPPFLGAGNVVIYIFFFGIYTSTLTYAILFHRREIVTGFKGLFNSMRKKKPTGNDEIHDLDVHTRLMKAYREVLLAGTLTHRLVLYFYGLALCLVFVIPVGIIKAMTGIEVTLTVLAEFIGGSFVEGNALAMNYFKSFGYVTCAHAVMFSNDLKLAHYVKIPPRHTFFAQIVATFISTFVCVGVLNFQMTQIPDVCTEDARWKMSCPSVNTFFTASVLWGTVGPKKIFGENGLYTEVLIGFPLGVVVVLAVWLLNKKFPNWTWTRQIHPVAIMYGGIVWAPYNMSYSRYLGLWSKYNFVLSAAWSCGIAIAGIVIFFALQLEGTELKWWGNTINYVGCEDDACPLQQLKPGEYFGPRVGDFH